MFSYTVGEGKIFYLSMFSYTVGGGGRTVLPHPRSLLEIFSQMYLYTVGVGKNWAGPFLPHPRSLLDIYSTRFLYTVGVGKNWAGPVLPHPRSFLDILFANVLVHSSGGEELGRPSSSPP